MTLGIGSYTFPWAVGLNGYMPAHPMTAFDLVLKAAGWGITRVQLADNLPLHQLSAEDQQKLLQRATASGIQIELGMRGLHPERVLPYLALAKQFSSSFLRIVLDEPGYEPAVPEIIRILQELVPVLQESQVILAIENHDRLPAAELEKIILATDANWVGICLDTANSFGCGEGIQEVLRILQPYVVNLHIKDVRIERVASKMGFHIQGVPAGDGQLPIPFILKELMKQPRCQSAILECWSNPLDSLEATLLQEAQWVQKSLTYLRTINLQA